MRRGRRSIAFFCVALLAVAALLPGGAGLDAVLAEPQWILLPDQQAAEPPVALVSEDEQPIALVSLLASRGPPAF
jgi:hypothetical protein